MSLDDCSYLLDFTDDPVVSAVLFSSGDNIRTKVIIFNVAFFAM